MTLFDFARLRLAARPSGLRGAAAGLAAVTLVACLASPFKLEELPERPLAFVYRTPDEAERRADMIHRAQTRSAPSASGRTSVRLEDVSDFLGLGPSELERRADMLGRLALLDARNGDVTKLPFARLGSRPLDWSEDGRRLLFRNIINETAQIFEYDRDSEEIRPITHGPASHSTACYGPDGRVAFSEWRKGGRSRILVTEPGGHRARPITSGPGDSHPDWSPDGSVLVYMNSRQGQRARIFAIDPSGRGTPRMIATGRDPTFTPDGQQVVYSAPTRQGWRLSRMRPDGSGKVTIGASPFDERDPTVSPDGRVVVYMAEEAIRQRLRIRTLQGTGDRPLDYDGDGTAPIW